MFYKLKTKKAAEKLNDQIKTILDTPPIVLQDAPWCVVSMVTASYTSMYLLALKSFYRKLGRGKVAVIVDRDTEQATLDTLAKHIIGIEFVILENIPTGDCQRGGTWERLLYCLDRSEREYTIQLDADTLTVGKNIDEVIHCVCNNLPFTMSDGFAIRALPDVAREAQVPSNYIGIVSEQKFGNYPNAQSWRYVRGSSGFAGFSKGGFTREGIAFFHKEMEKLVGLKRWREWGTEQCGSNFAIANSPNAFILPFPEYESFGSSVLREPAKFFHMIGASRYIDGYYGYRGQQLIAELNGAPPTKGIPVEAEASPPGPMVPAVFKRFNSASAAKYLARRMLGGSNGSWLTLRNGVKLHLTVSADDKLASSALDNIFLYGLLKPPVWIPRVRVFYIVEMGENRELSSLHWLNEYWLSNVLVFADDTSQLHSLQSTAQRNQYENRLSVHSMGFAERNDAHVGAVQSSSKGPLQIRESASAIFDVCDTLLKQRIDILKVRMNNDALYLLMDPRFSALEVNAVVFEWTGAVAPDAVQPCNNRLAELGYRRYPLIQRNSHNLFWAYKVDRDATGDSLRWI